jgi:hypothetical protein
MKVTMVKKRLLSGDECPKCREATEFLKSKGVFERLDGIEWFDEADPTSRGHVLAEQFQMERAPFFIVERPGKPAEALDSVMRVYKLL